MNPSIRFKFDFHHFQALPLNIHEKILAKLSPLEMLELANVNEYFDALVRFSRKRYTKFSSLKCDEIEIESIQGQRFGREYRLGKADSKHDRYLDSPLVSVCEILDGIGEGKEKRLKRMKAREMGILLTNSEVLLLNNAADLEMITWRMRVRRITDPKIRTIDELFAIIDGLRVSELYLIHQPVYFKGKEGSVLVQRFLDNEKIQSLKWLKMECEQGWLKKFSALRIPKIFLRVNINSQDESKRFLKDLETFCEKILQEWERGEREMNFIHLYMYPWVYERKQYDLSYFVTDQLAEKLTKTREGSFKDHNIDKRFQLIDRKIDKKGLLIVSGENGIIFVECDYAFRRNRGLGNTYTKILQLIDPIEDLLEGIWSHELTKWEKRREAKRTKKINNYFDYHQRDLDERIEEDKACLKRHLDEWIDFSEGIPRRELAIDQLWDNLHKKISISDSLFDYDSYPDELNFDNDKYKKALEFAEEYRIFRRLPSIFTY